VGTRGSEIVELKASNRWTKAQVLMRGHFNNELWGLTVHPTQNTFYTVGEDGLLALWDSHSRKQIHSVNIKLPAKQIHVSPDGQMLAVGCKNGEIKIFDQNLN